MGQWTASDLPVPLSYLCCLIHEIDLLIDVAPFIVTSGVVHQFPWNDTDRLVRVVSKPPIPFVSGLEAVSQRFCFDLLDTPWEAFCLVDFGPEWTKVPNASQEVWRGVPKPPPYQKGLKGVEVKKIVALGKPCGPEGKLTTIIFSGRGDLKVPRWMLPNSLITWLTKTVGRYVFEKAMELVAKFDSSNFAPRLTSNPLYSDVNERIAKFAERQQR